MELTGLGIDSANTTLEEHAWWVGTPISMADSIKDQVRWWGSDLSNLTLKTDGKKAPNWGVPMRGIQAMMTIRCVSNKDQARWWGGDLATFTLKTDGKKVPNWGVSMRGAQTMMTIWCDAMMIKKCPIMRCWVPCMACGVGSGLSPSKKWEPPLMHRMDTRGPPVHGNK